MTESTSTIGNASELEHRIGSNGRFSLRLPSGSAIIRGVDGDIARVNDLSGLPLAERFQIETSPDGLELSLRQRLSISLQIGKHGWGSPSPELEIELPRGTRIGIETASADVKVIGLSGAARYRTASGDIELQAAGGDLEIEAVSGDTRIDAVAVIEVKARSISGDFQLRAPRLGRFELNTTSGDVRLDAELGGKGPFSIKSISGDVTLVARNGIQVEAQTITGDLSSPISHRMESVAGRKMLTVGRPSATLAFKSVSGDLRIVEPRDAAPLANVAPAAQATADAADGPAGVDPRLEILRALERGEIDVATATDRLTAIEED
jgi:hypothetical protein